MSSFTKQEILEAMRQTAKQNDGKPLGRDRFVKETGIKPYDLEQYWAKFGDAQKEAGFEPNTLTVAYTDDFLIGKLIALIRKLGSFPSYGQLKLETRNNVGFPSAKSIFETKEQKREIANKIIKWCEGKKEYDDIIKSCEPIVGELNKKEDFGDADISKCIGEVYLYKSGRYYKIGKTNDTVRRGKEIRIQLPERTDLIHTIKTDDPSGIEAYWHKRFEAKRLQGEWFNLTFADIRAFKRWKRIV